MVATSGDLLLRDDAVEAYERELFPLAALVTPNLDEAARLLGEPIGDLQAMRTAGARLTEKYRIPVLLKGGHLSGQDAIDLLFVAGNVVEFSAPFSRGIATHGTGCTYSAAITAGLASGLSLEGAVRRAKKFVTATIAQHLSWETASGASLHALNHSPDDCETPSSPINRRISTESRPTAKRAAVEFFSAACSQRFYRIASTAGGRLRLFLTSSRSFSERDAFPHGANNKRLLVLRPALRDHLISGTAR